MNTDIKTIQYKDLQPGDIVRVQKRFRYICQPEFHYCDEIILIGESTCNLSWLKTKLKDGDYKDLEFIARSPMGIPVKGAPKCKTELPDRLDVPEGTRLIETFR